MNPVDLRSDTITKPTPEMREAIANAEVGDDVFSDDPTVNLLQEWVAELVGKEAALFVASGTMSNQIAINISTTEGTEVVVEYNSHIFNYESGGPAFLSRVQLHPITAERGILDVESIVDVIRAKDDHLPQTSLVCIENTHNRGGGSIYPLESVKAISEMCRDRGLRLHLDGARLWNACAATGLKPTDYAQHVDTLSVCFSKGLGAPIGSVLAGTHDDIARAHQRRKVFGGGMRQVGILAAGALFALKNHRERLVDDHKNARKLAEGLHGLPGFNVDPDEADTNLIFIGLDERHCPADRFVERLAEHGVLLLDERPNRIRAVTSLAVDEDDIDRAIEVFRKLVK